MSAYSGSSLPLLIPFSRKTDGRAQLLRRRQFSFQFFRQGWLQLVVCYSDGISLRFQREFHLYVIFLRTQNDPNRWIVVGPAFLVIKHVQVEIHLARILRFELADLQLDRNQTLQKTVVEEQIDKVFLRPSHHPVLPADEVEPIPIYKKSLQTY